MERNDLTRYILHAKRTGTRLLGVFPPQSAVCAAKRGGSPATGLEDAGVYRQKWKEWSLPLGPDGQEGTEGHSQLTARSASISRSCQWWDENCQLVENVQWFQSIDVDIFDYDRGYIYSTPVTSRVAEITNILNDASLNNNTPYFSGYLEEATFHLSTTTQFEQYEVYETIQSINLRVDFTCTDGTTGSQLFHIFVQDTNNHYPEFIPYGQYDFTIMPPLLPGYVIGSCDFSIVVKDIDLTTSRIDFVLTGSDYFEIVYDEASSTEPKMFKAILRTTTFIRTLPDSVELTISATDVDETGDPPLTSYATVLIHADNDLSLPEEPVFTRAIYTATYTESNEVVLDEPISLYQGYNIDVAFTLDEDYRDYFELIIDDNKVSLQVILPLSNEILMQSQIYLIVRAHREFTSGATTTVVIQLPEVITLQFERSYYEGVIIDNTLLISDLILTQGYEGHTVSVEVSNDYFSATILENRITLTKSPLPDSVIEENMFLNLEVTASTDHSSATAIVTLEIIKDDTTTPLFEKALYEGTYDSTLGLLIEQIVLVQGYDDSVSVTFDGVHASFFRLQRDGPNSTLTVESLPSEIFREQSLTLIITATKPRTIGATAIVHITLPEVITLQFERSYYEGVIIDNALSISDLVLTQGYEGHTVSVVVSNDYFSATIQENRITLTKSQLPESIIEENSFLNLEVTASTDHSSATAIVTLEIIKDDTTTPLFERALYEGTYDPTLGLIIDRIYLVQGYDDTVSVTFDGVHASYFELQRDGPNSTLTVESLPVEIFSEQSLTLTVSATKPRTIGATAVVHITLPQDHISHFQLSNNRNEVTISLLEPLPESIVLENNFLMLILSAADVNAETATTSLLIDIIQDNVTTPTFSENIYHVTYNSDGTIEMKEDIYLLQGYDSTITFNLDGVGSEYFAHIKEENNIKIYLDHPIPESLIFEDKALVFNIIAEKPLTVGANAAILVTFPTDHYTYFTKSNVNDIVSIDLSNTLPTDIIKENQFIILELEARRERAMSVFCTVIIELVKHEDVVIFPVFNKAYYKGNYNNDTGLQFDEKISLAQGYSDSVTFHLEGEYSNLFTVFDNNNNTITISTNEIPNDVLEGNDQIFIVLVARTPDTIDSRAAVVIDFPKEQRQDNILEFGQINYVGSIENDVVNLTPITLTQGYSEDVTFTLYGALESYFALLELGATVTLQLRNSIPEESIPANQIIVLELSASAGTAVPAVATLILEVVLDDDSSPIPDELSFAETYYVATYNTGTGLVQENAISLSEGYDENVAFDLEGDDSRYFSLNRSGNSVTLLVPNAIPPEILASNNQFLFIVTAQRPGSTIAWATVAVLLPDELTETNLLGFDQINYVGSIENDVVNLTPITLTQGYSEDVTFTLYGALESYFALSELGATVTLQLRNSIPEESIPANQIIVLELSASAGTAVPAVATLILEVVLDDDSSPTPDELSFAETYYVATYITGTGLVQENAISLSEGYDENVAFDLEGDDSRYFSLNRSGNSVTLLVPNAIPPEILASNNQFLFIVTAQRPGSTIARATVAVLLPDELTETNLLGFDQINYVGSIENDVVNLTPITLTQGYSEDVTFTLYGALESYFALSELGATVTLQLRNSIPEESIPANQIIVLELSASAGTAVPAVATLILEVVLDDDSSPIPDELSFAETYYVATYITATGLVQENAISLSEGYDENVAFDLEGDDSRYFSLNRSGNSVTLLVPNAIPPEILASNNQFLFIVTAQRPGSTIARATVAVLLPDELTETNLLGFDQINYVGSIENDVVNLTPITLTQGYSEDVTFTLYGALESYFALSELGATVTLQLRNSIPEESIPANQIIVLELSASAGTAVPAVATLILEVVLDDDSSPIPDELSFAETYYVATYITATGLVQENAISLSEGYDENVAFDLEGDDSRYFSLNRSGNSVTLLVPNAIPPEILASNNQFLFIVTAQRPGSTIARATVAVLLPDELTETNLLGFDQINYVGSIENDVVNLTPITLTQGYSEDVTFTLYGALESYFALSELGATVTLQLRNSIPEESIPANQIIVLELSASAGTAVPAVATLILEVVLDDDSSPIPDELSFAETYYVATYITATGLVQENAISLSEGYDENVAFDLEGDDSRYFSLNRSGNSVTLLVPNAIPPEILASNNQFLFIVTAQRPGSTIARATVAVLLPDELTETDLLGFDQINYVGSIENDVVNLTPITLTQGYSEDVTFTLYGALESYFALSELGATVTLQLRNSIPEESIPANQIIVLELSASAGTAVPAVATLILEVVLDDDSSPIPDELSFAETYYVATYITATGLVQENAISLSEGYDENVAFDLEGDDSRYFSLNRSGNSVTLLVPNAIPPEILASNNQFLFIVTAQRPGSTIARATVAVLLPDELTETNLLGFDQINYVGSIENDVVNLTPITLTQGYSEDVTFTLYGALESYFALSELGATVTLQLRNSIPEESIPANQIIVLELSASAGTAVPAVATLILEVVLDDDSSPIPDELSFAETYYVATYITATGLVQENAISLSEGYDENVAFDLEGDDSRYFSLNRSGNSVTLLVPNAIPPEILASNNQFLFIVTAQRPGSTIARATVAVLLPDELTETNLLGFDQINYVGSIENDVVNLTPITLTQGYSEDVTFTLYGALESYFALSELGATVTLQLRNSIPEESIPANQIIVLELSASAGTAVPAVATLILEVVLDDDSSPIPDELSFAETYYVATYITATGLVQENAISLSEGYDENVAFDLEGDDSRYFSLNRSGNSVTLLVPNAIPPEILASNNQFLFIVTAQRPGSTIARATVAVLLPDELTETNLLGFDQINYVGSIENDVVNLTPITLTQGYSEDVTFTLYGALESYFALSVLGATVTLQLRNSIPEESIPANQIIVLELSASAGTAVPAVATLILEVVLDDDSSPIPDELSFAETYYVATYIIATGLVQENAISLSEGYDENVAFDLEGDDSRYFSLNRSGNSVTLLVPNAIPPEILASNNQFLFIVTAQRPGSTIARATVAVLLPDELTETNLLGFDQINYVGSIENDVVNLTPITLTQGYSEDVTFTLYGALESYFALSELGATVTLQLRNSIPEESIPANQIIVLELSASAGTAVPAVATLILEVVLDDDSSPIPDELSFAETYYVATYITATGLVQENAISLSEGYDENVAFDLEGDDSRYFSLNRSGNSVTLLVPNAIPPEILASNNQFLFIVTAQRPGSTIARATVAVLLPDELTETNLLGFDQINYVGSIENDVVNLTPITLTQGYSEDVTFTLYGALESYFALSELGATVTLQLRNSIPEESIPANQIIVLELSASAGTAVPAVATLILEVVLDDDSSPIPDELSFAETYYVATYITATGLVQENAISLSEGYDENVAFDLEGDDSRYFSLNRSGNSVTLLVPNAIPPEILASNNQFLFIVTAQRPGSTIARATVAALESYFALSELGATVTLQLRNSIPEESIPANQIIVLELSASAGTAVPAVATLIFEVVLDDDSSPIPDELSFAETYYVATYITGTGLVQENAISLSEGYDENVAFDLEGDDSRYFSLNRSGNSVTLLVPNALPPEILASNNQFLFIVTAQRPGSTIARATVAVLLPDDSEVSPDVFFSQFIYEGILQGSAVHHETITVSGFYGTNIEILGEYSSLFMASLSEGSVIVQTVSSAVLPTNVAYIALQLRAGGAESVLLLEVHEETQTLPTVTFSSPSYVLRVEISQTGFIGSVLATADNGETISYSLLNNNEHLQSRLTINNNGDLHLSSQANSGVYTFQVIATTLFTQVTATASAYLTVESAAVCEDDIVVPPLIVLDRDEEEEHKNLVVLNDAEFPGCQYRLINRWPVDQDWLYVDESGLHTRSIDREHESIAFMALSQVQVELVLECDSDISRIKRSLDADTKTEWLGPYDYGNSNWILAETILYNSRRSFVNLIVNDINDNAPIFIGKENEPIVVGYPVAELEEIILTRYLVKIEATDADIGENAALSYWTNAHEVAVSPLSGIVYAADTLSDQLTLTISATDQRGQGLTGSIQLLVRLLDVDNIVIVTVHDMFLEDEQTILDQLSSTLGYEVKILRSSVVPSEPEEENTNEEAMRKKRDTTDTGISLQLYIYGLNQREPITADRLTEDIMNSQVTAVSITSTIRLEDYLEGRDTCVGPGRDVGLLAATIVLSVILFLVIVAIAVWFFLKWRKDRNYDQFSDQASLGSDNSVSQSPKLESYPTPRINIEELKKSERRLKEMLDAPYIEQPEERVERITPNNDNPLETVIDMPLPDSVSAIVIEDKLNDADLNHSDEDEFGEIKLPRRKSIVTFNENVQKIIHVEDNPDNGSDSDVEIYNF
ncbi:uncharacterized protein ACR2FA_003587 [Aphomia sociella]